MVVTQIPADPNIDPLKNQAIQLKKQSTASKNESIEKQASQGDSVEISQMARDIGKYRSEIENIPSPNEGRIAELKQAVKDGTLLTPESIDGAATAIANSLLK